ncbi:MAG: recombination protein RecR [Candidatus Omnitrophica bacterium]|nr:recombination protein RecR [Candidatus Omnitrophota bacterium]
MSYPRLVQNLIEQLTQLPGVGRRSAERMVFWFLDNSAEQSREFSESIIRLKEGLMFCKECNNLSESEVCLICENPARDHKTICVVEDHKHLLAIEKTGMYKGLYHVLLGPISPAEGRGPDDLKVHTLINRVRAGDVKEVVIATDPDTEGEMTAIHLTNELKPLGVKVSRIGVGIPMGSSVEYVDASTLAMSMISRREIVQHENSECIDSFTR